MLLNWDHFLFMKSINTLINKKTTTLHALSKKIENLNLLTAVLHKILPKDYGPYCQVVRYEEELGLLVLSTSEQSFVTLLRYSTPQLIEKLIKSFSGFQRLKNIQIIYTPIFSRNKIEKSTTIPHAPEAFLICKQAAEYCCPSLQKALKRLSNTLHHLSDQNNS